MAEPSALRCTGVTVRYGAVRAVDAVDLHVAAGELVALLGASGSGKSTLLHAVAGLVQPDAGEIWIGAQQVCGGKRAVAPERRSVGLVFQDFALWPHLSALDTVAYPLRRAGCGRPAARRIAQAHLDTLGIGNLSTRRPAQLSGGQQQRVGLARALARDPRLFLLDEPTAHLDTHLRGTFQDAVRERLTAGGAAAVYATHDAGEALGISERVALLVDGRLVQVGTPDSVYAEPVSEAAAALTGDYAMADADECGVPERGQVLLRPEWVRPAGPLRSVVALRTFRGSHTDYQLDVGAARVLMRVPGPPQHAPGDALEWGVHRYWVLPGAPSRSVSRVR